MTSLYLCVCVCLLEVAFRRSARGDCSRLIGLLGVAVLRALKRAVPWHVPLACTSRDYGRRSFTTRTTETESHTGVGLTSFRPRHHAGWPHRSTELHERLGRSCSSNSFLFRLFGAHCWRRFFDWRRQRAARSACGGLCTRALYNVRSSRTVQDAVSFGSYAYSGRDPHGPRRFRRPDSTPYPPERELHLHRSPDSSASIRAGRELWRFWSARIGR